MAVGRISQAVDFFQRSANKVDLPLKRTETTAAEGIIGRDRSTGGPTQGGRRVHGPSRIVGRSSQHFARANLRGAFAPASKPTSREATERTSPSQGGPGRGFAAVACTRGQRFGSLRGGERSSF